MREIDSGVLFLLNNNVQWYFSKIYDIGRMSTYTKEVSMVGKSALKRAWNLALAAAIVAAAPVLLPIAAKRRARQKLLALAAGPVRPGKEKKT